MFSVGSYKIFQNVQFYQNVLYAFGMMQNIHKRYMLVVRRNTSHFDVLVSACPKICNFFSK